MLTAHENHQEARARGDVRVRGARLTIERNRVIPARRTRIPSVAVFRRYEPC